MTGGSKLIGSCMVNLLTKLPWNPQDYIPPRSHMILEEAVKARLALNAAIMKAPVPNVSHAVDAEEEAVAELISSRDTGYGVFPLLPGKGQSAQYLELPVIVDRYRNISLPCVQYRLTRSMFFNLL